MRIKLCREKLYKQDFSELTVIESSVEADTSRSILMDDAARVVALMIQED